MGREGRWGSRALTPVALHVSPHPDDELIGAPATLMALRDAGWRIVNLACSLGRPGQRERREAELQEACKRAGYELRIAAGPVSVSREIDELEPAIVCSPALGDRHPSHRRVAEAVREALALHPAPPRWWAWELWGSLPEPTLGTLFDQARLEEILAALSAHRGELARNDYRRFVRARAEMNVTLAAELLFGFGASTPVGVRYAELLTEFVRDGDRWLLGSRRWLDASDPLPQPSGDEATLR